jgi:hypothetical protein
MLETKNMCSNLRRERVHKEPKYRLISGHPRRIGWVRDCDLLAIFVINLQRLLQSNFSAIKKPKSKSTTDRWENKCEPEEIVCAGKFLRGGSAKGNSKRTRRRR